MSLLDPRSEIDRARAVGWRMSSFNSLQTPAGTGRRPQAQSAIALF